MRPSVFHLWREFREYRNLWKMLRNSTAGLPRVTPVSRVIRTLLAVVCGRDVTKNDSLEQGVESCGRECGNSVQNDYEDLKGTGYLEVVYSHRL